MHKFLLVAGLLLSSALGARAQTHILKANIFSPMVNTGSFFYEHKLNDHSSVQFGALFTHWNIGETKITGYAFTPEYRLYLSENKQAPQGFYVAPFARFQNLTLSVDEMIYDGSNNGNGRMTTLEASLNTFGGGLVVGHQWIFGQHFSLDTFVGPSYNGGTLKARAGSQTASFNPGPFTGFGVRTGLTFGLAF